MLSYASKCFVVYSDKTYYIGGCFKQKTLQWFEKHGEIVNLTVDTPLGAN